MRVSRESRPPRATRQRVKASPASPSAFSARIALVARRAQLKTCVACQPSCGDDSAASHSAAAASASDSTAGASSGDAVAIAAGTAWKNEENAPRARTAHKRLPRLVGRSRASAPPRAGGRGREQSWLAVPARREHCPEQRSAESPSPRPAPRSVSVCGSFFCQLVVFAAAGGRHGAPWRRFGLRRGARRRRPQPAHAVSLQLAGGAGPGLARRLPRRAVHGARRARRAHHQVPHLDALCRAAAPPLPALRAVQSALPGARTDVSTAGRRGTVRRRRLRVNPCWQRTGRLERAQSTREQLHSSLRFRCPPFSCAQILQLLYILLISIPAPRAFLVQNPPRCARRRWRVAQGSPGASAPHTLSLSLDLRSMRNLSAV